MLRGPGSVKLGIEPERQRPHRQHRDGFCFFFERWAVRQFSLVVHGSLLCDERHVSGGSTVNGTTKNAVVGVGRSSKRFPCATGKGVAALLARPNADGLSLDLLVLANGAGVLAGSLGHGRAGVSADGHTVACSGIVRWRLLSGFALPISSPPFLLQVLEVPRIAFVPIEDLGKLGGSEHPF